MIRSDGVLIAIALADGGSGYRGLRPRLDLAQLLPPTQDGLISMTDRQQRASSSVTRSPMSPLQSPTVFIAIVLETGPRDPHEVELPPVHLSFASQNRTRRRFGDSRSIEPIWFGGRISP